MAEQPKDFGTEVKSFFSSTFGGLWGSITGQPQQPQQPETRPQPARAAGQQQPHAQVNRQANPNAPNSAKPPIVSAGSRGSAPDLGVSRNTAAVKGTGPRSNSLTSLEPASPKALEDGWMVLDESDKRNEALPAPNVPMVDEDEDELTIDSPENIERFQAVLGETKVNVDFLRSLVWKYGAPVQFRPQVWRILLGILPPWPYLHNKLLDLKRQYYHESAPKYWNRSDTSNEEKHLVAMIRSGFQNTGFRLRLFKNTTMLNMVTRVVYIFLKENSALSYHDAFSQIPLVLIFAFMSSYVPAGTDLTKISISEGAISPENLKNLEVDLYLSLTAVFENQGGLKDMFSSNPTSNVELLQKLVAKLDPALAEHFNKCDVQYMTFAYPWLEAFFIDQILRMPVLVLMWDRYIASNRFVKYHVCVCVQVLLRNSRQILRQDSPLDLYYFLQNLPLHRIDPELMDAILDGSSKIFADAKIATPPSDSMVDIDNLVQKRRRRAAAQAEQAAVAKMLAEEAAAATVM